jgi:RNA recognition motif-containing protein
VKVNKAVWVTKIPLDAQKDEIRERFAKFGVIAENEMGEARIKMYEDEAGKFKGEALVVYFRPESVDLAINMLDETDFRLGVSDPAGPMRVEVADSSYKTHQPDDQEKPKLSLKDKRKMTEQNERLNRYVDVFVWGRCSFHADLSGVENSRTGMTMTSPRLSKSPPSTKRLSFSSICLLSRNWRFVTRLGFSYASLNTQLTQKLT